MAPRLITEYIVVHHSATRDGRTYDWHAVRRYHTEVKGWRDIGYHVGFEMAYLRPEVLMGRAPEEIGAHCRAARMNDRSIGIMFMGNYDVTEPPDGLLARATPYVRFLLDHYRLGVDRVIGHNEAQAMDGVLRENRKTCPGTLFDIKAFRRRVGGV